MKRQTGFLKATDLNELKGFITKIKYKFKFPFIERSNGEFKKLNKYIACSGCGWLATKGSLLFKVENNYFCTNCLGFYTQQDVDKIKEEEYQRGKDEQMFLDKIQYGERFKIWVKNDDKKLIKLISLQEIKSLVFKMHKHEIRCVNDEDEFIGEFQTERPYIDSLDFEKEIDKLLKGNQK